MQKSNLNKSVIFAGKIYGKAPKYLNVENILVIGGGQEIKKVNEWELSKRKKRVNPVRTESREVVEMKEGRLFGKRRAYVHGSQNSHEQGVDLRLMGLRMRQNEGGGGLSGLV